MVQPPVRVLVVGLGHMGQSHALAYHKLEGFEIAGLMSRTARARVIPLKVAGAFHTEHMAPAVDALREHVAGLAPQDPRTPLLSNRDGAAVADGRDAVGRIVDQVTRPVRWDLCMAALAARGVTGVLELLPGGTLTGLAKRGLKGTATCAVKAPEDLEAARAFIAEHTA